MSANGILSSRNKSERIMTMKEEKKELLLQLNIPFCYRKCSYCGMPTCSYNESLIRSHCKAMQKEIIAVSQDMDDYLVTAISIEGGSPALTPPEELQKLLFLVKKEFHMAENIMISLQTNPGEYSRSMIQRMRDQGVNHWIFGIQTTAWKEHDLLKRPYRWDTLSMVDVAVRNFDMHDRSFELLYGIPGQTEHSFLTSLEKVLSYAPEHITLYPLRLEEGTELKNLCDHKQLEPPDPALREQMYNRARELLTKIGLQAYTIYDFARPGHENRYRLGQLCGVEQIGIGYQANSRIDGVVYRNGHSLKEYIEHSDELPVIANGLARPDEESLFRQEIISNLTLSAGLSLESIQKKYQKLVACQHFLDDTVNELTESRVAVKQGDKLTLTPFGIVTAHQILQDL
jgi:oxygen-independent coproporphyrinogen-3 oxidase